jgi:hypothetical protein
MKKAYFIIYVLLFSTLSLKAQWGEGDTRTESRNDAGLQGNAGAKSGFYQTSNPINFPTGAQDWWHLLDIRHSAPSNNFAMQFAGNFYDQSLYFRKTAGNPAQSWSKVLTIDNAGVLSNERLVLQTTAGQSFFTGHQIGETYSNSKGVFSAITDNNDGSLNYFYDGITNGSRKFYVKADGTGYFAGLIGVGTETPIADLDVNGTFVAGGNVSNLDSSNPNRNLKLLENTGKMLIGWNKSKGAGETDFVGNPGGGSIGGFAFYNHSNEGIEKQLMWITGEGKLLIGIDGNPVSTANYKMAVGGGVIAESVTVKLQGNWPDFVFEEKYKLMPLKELRTFVDRYQHLPGIPTALEVSKAGLNLGEMNTKLLRKVEELTLYLLEKDKQLDAQNLQISQLNNQFNELKLEIRNMIKINDSNKSKIDE